MNSNFTKPINIGSEEMVSINQLVNIVSDIKQKHNNKSDGRRTRNSKKLECFRWDLYIPVRH